MPINTPGNRNIGEKRTAPLSLTTIDTVNDTTAPSIRCSEPSIIPMSCVHRVMIREVGVASSQLIKSFCTVCPLGEANDLPKRCTKN